MKEPIPMPPPLDGDESFFNSLLPIVRTFTEEQKLEFRTDTLQLIRSIRQHGSVNYQIFQSDEAYNNSLQQERASQFSQYPYHAPQQLPHDYSHPSISVTPIYII